MQFVAYQYAQMLQTISTGRADKKITTQDIKNVMAMAYSSIFPGTTMFGKLKNHYPLGYWPHMWIYYVKGISDTEACVMWELACFNSGPELCTDTSNSRHPRSVINFIRGKNMSTTSIYPKLKIKKDEIKIIVECTIVYAGGCYFDDNRNCSTVSAKSALGFLIISPKSRGIINGNFFTSIAIITPKEGLFDATLPR